MFNKYKFKIGTLMVSLAAFFGCPYLVKEISPRPVRKYSEQWCINEVKKVDRKLEKENHPRKVDLEVLVDKSFINRHGKDWWDKLSEDFEFVDSKFRERFGIDFDIDSVKYFKLPEGSPDDIYFSLTYLHLKLKPGKYDAFVLISGKRYPKAQGICYKLGNHSIAAPRKKVPLKRVLQHEFSHLFNAEDLRASDTIMSNSDRFSYKWSRDNAVLVGLNSRRTWDGMNEWYYELIRDNIDYFPKKDIEDVSKLFCYQACKEFHQGGVELAEELLKKYPENPFIQGCYDNILDLLE